MLNYDKNIVGDNIYKYRSNAQMTQRSLADSIGVKASLISAYERSIQQPSINTLQKIADVLGITIDHLMTKVWDNKQNDIDLELKAYLLNMNISQRRIITNIIDYMLNEKEKL